MAINICVTRQPGCCQDTMTDGMKGLCKFAPPITNPLIASAEVATQAGRNVIDREYSNRQSLTGTIAPHDYMAPGNLVRVERDDETFTGMLDTYSITFQRSGKNLQVSSAVKIERTDDKCAT